MGPIIKINILNIEEVDDEYDDFKENKLNASTRINITFQSN